MAAWQGAAGTGHNRVFSNLHLNDKPPSLARTALSEHCLFQCTLQDALQVCSERGVRGQLPPWAALPAAASLQGHATTILLVKLAAAMTSNPLWQMRGDIYRMAEGPVKHCP